MLKQWCAWLMSCGAVLALVCLPVAVPSASAYSGGFYDDGLYDDDWYVDYYDAGFSRDDFDSSSLGNDREEFASFESDDEYDVNQFYDDAGESGLFDV